MIVAAAVLLVAAGLCFLCRAVLGPSLADRIVALDGFVVVIVSGIVVHAAYFRTARFVDVALVVAFVGFVGTVAGARFIQQRGG
jgi:multicomponent Na+:H+ antiporter subunit F